MAKFTHEALSEMFKANKFESLKSKNEGVQRIIDEGGQKLDGLVDSQWKNYYSRYDRKWGWSTQEPTDTTEESPDDSATMSNS